LARALPTAAVPLSESVRSAGVPASAPPPPQAAKSTALPESVRPQAQREIKECFIEAAPQAGV
jgi:hypothetical protein